GVIVAMILAAIDQTIVVTAMPTIGHALGQAEYLPWIITAYLLASTAVTPLYGKVSDIVGRRVTLLFAIVVFILGSVLCAMAPNMVTLILARGFQGLGGGGLMSMAQTIIADIVSPKERSRYQVYIAGVYMLSSVAGPLLGGYFSEHWSWTMIFWINLPLGALALAMTYSLLRRLPRHERPHKLDVLGALLMATAAVTMMLALNWGGKHFGWSSSQIIGLFAISAMLWAAFMWRLRTAPEPFIPTEILSNSVVALGTLTAMLIMGCYIGITAFLPIYLELAYGLSASQSGIALIPFMSGTVVGAIIAGQFMARTVRYKIPGTVGLLFSVLGMILLSLMKVTPSLLLIEVIIGGLSVGLGTVFPLTTVSIQNAVAAHQMGTATGVMNFFRSLGGALVVAIFGAVLFAQLPSFASMEGSGGVRLADIMARSTIHTAFRPVFALTAGLLGLAFLLFSRMPQKPLRSSVKVADTIGE
ncbi:MAG: MFS transporter, partial [Alphaproteobacteria bacterium]|nr:MFS transporter [Alphaproteobacteria bacterium]